MCHDLICCRQIAVCQKQELVHESFWKFWNCPKFILDCIFFLYFCHLFFPLHFAWTTSIFASPLPDSSMFLSPAVSTPPPRYPSRFSFSWIYIVKKSQTNTQKHTSRFPLVLFPQVIHNTLFRCSSIIFRGQWRPQHDDHTITRHRYTVPLFGELSKWSFLNLPTYFFPLSLCQVLLYIQCQTCCKVNLTQIYKFNLNENSFNVPQKAFPIMIFIHCFIFSGTKFLLRHVFFAFFPPSFFPRKKNFPLNLTLPKRACQWHRTWWWMTAQLQLWSAICRPGCIIT